MEKASLLKEGERLDDLQRSGLFLIQNPKMFCFGIDAVLLSSFTSVKEGDRLLDLCTGNGAVALLLAGKTAAKEIYGLELQEAVYDMANRSAKYNNLEDRVHFVHGDVRKAGEYFPPSSFDVITANPPYLKSGAGLVGDLSAKTIARHEVMLSLEELISRAGTLLAPGGSFFIVHRPFRLVDLMVSLRENKLEPKRMRLVHSRQDKEPSLVLLQAVRGGKPDLSVEEPLIVYQEDGSYTDDLMHWYYE